ncbi:MAG: bifunctional protein-serine/threonine kinase/phosphatase [Methylococcaceae bacterium]|nr:bifunctional protein-serine/threonine kinase/phosphatase [Methylococcaceae bacterium]MCI0667920.1 bifunctional protein-serine/threonine kinase/phosphatase [Methylococcaceae bacterium]MCI0733498.1 bifunctional protein-serine/threonine kinase/phosphatase [Methylococcaceae bacterium]
MNPKLEISIGQFSDKGIKTDNEDFYGFSKPNASQLIYKGIAVAISDGMSGSEGGKQASRACIIGFLSDYFSTPDSWSVEKSVQKILSATNNWLYSNGHSQYQSPKGLAATLSILIFKSNTAYLFHIGDSRIYRLRENHLEQMTHDHRISTPNGQSYLNRAMGIEPHLNVDCRKLELQRGDLFVLTTDGVHDFIPQKTLKDLVLDNSADLEAGAKAIVETAAANHSDDNLTCQIVRVDSLPLADNAEIAQQNANRPFPPPLEPGMILDGYRIDEEIHASKRTQIYKALDTRGNRTVILKTPSINYQDDPVYIERFLQEEWAGRRIDDSHVLKVLDADRPKKWIYYVTEYLEGQSLRRWMDNHPRPDVKTAIDLACQISKGLRALHRLEMLHQDLKPENIMIDRENRIKLIDFGSVKIAGIAEIRRLEDEDTILGTLNYSAPEYLMGQRCDTRSDLFSLAVIIYEMLNGALPFDRGMPEKPDRVKLARLKYVPSIHLNAMVPVWIDGALSKALSINPERRYEDLSEFVHDLGHPNPLFLNTPNLPLIQRNPLAFWQSLAALLAIGNLILIYLLTHS